MLETYAGLRLLALSLNLPRVEDGTGWGNSCLRAHGKMWVWWSPYMDAAVFSCLRDERDMLLAADPDTFALHPHYAAHPLILVRAGHIDPGWAKARLTARWRDLAPKRWLKDWDAGGAEGSGCPRFPFSATRFARIVRPFRRWPQGRSGPAFFGVFHGR